MWGASLIKWYIDRFFKFEVVMLWEVLWSPFEIQRFLDVYWLFSKGLSYAMLCILRFKLIMYLVKLVRGVDIVDVS